MTNYYDQVKSRDLISKIRHLLTNGGYYLRDDGKFTAERRLAWDQPWHHVRHHPALDCMTWHHILFDNISMRLPEKDRFVPSKCQDCYKVVVRPNTLKQLFVLLEVQKALGIPCKCGIETRPTVHGLYGGYFYNIGLEQGIECYKRVRAAVDVEPDLGPDVTVLLKRACTEYEHALGDSSKWMVTPLQKEIEVLVDSLVTKDDVSRLQPEHALMYLHRKWIEFAYMNGDPTYAEFTGGKPLYPPYVTYHHLAEEKQDA